MMMKMTSAHSWPWLRRSCCTLIVAAMILFLSGCGGKSCRHNWQEATCTEVALCTKCGETKGEPIGHTYSGQTCTGVDKCIVCGAIVPASGHVWVDATCTSPMTCGKCGETKGEPIEHTLENGICTLCGEVIEKEESSLTKSGTGSQTIKDIKIGYDFYSLHIAHQGSGQFELKMTDSTGASAILVHTSGKYEGTVLIYGASPLTFIITADGDWAYEIDKIEAEEGTRFSGTGDSVTPKFSAASGSYHITHSGSGNFYVYAFYPGGVVGVIKPGDAAGKYDANIDLQFPAGAEALFEVHANGEWSITKN